MRKHKYKDTVCVTEETKQGQKMIAQIHPGTSETAGHNQIKKKIIKVYCKMCQLGIKAKTSSKNRKPWNKLLKKCSGISSN